MKSRSNKVHRHEYIRQAGSYGGVFKKILQIEVSMIIQNKLSCFHQLEILSRNPAITNYIYKIIRKTPSQKGSRCCGLNVCFPAKFMLKF